MDEERLRARRGTSGGRARTDAPSGAVQRHRDRDRARRPSPDLRRGMGAGRPARQRAARARPEARGPGRRAGGQLDRGGGLVRRRRHRQPRAVPLYPRNRPRATLHMLGHTGCRVLVVEREVRPDALGHRRTSCPTSSTSSSAATTTRTGWRASPTIDPTSADRPGRLLHHPPHRRHDRPAEGRRLHPPARGWPRAGTGSTTSRRSSRATRACTSGRSRTARATCSCRPGCRAG